MVRFREDAGDVDEEEEDEVVDVRCALVLLLSLDLLMQLLAPSTSPCTITDELWVTSCEDGGVCGCGAESKLLVLPP